MDRTPARRNSSAGSSSWSFRRSTRRWNGPPAVRRPGPEQSRYVLCQRISTRSWRVVPPPRGLRWAGRRAGRRTRVDEARGAVERVARESYGRLIAYLAARTHDVAGAEDALADAFVAALRVWPDEGVPGAPEAW